MRYAASGESQAKGRNGYFKVTEIEAWGGSPDDTWPVRISLRSKRQGDVPPLVMDLSREDARLLIEALQEPLVQLALRERYPEYDSRFRAVGWSGVYGTATDGGY